MKYILILLFLFVRLQAIAIEKPILIQSLKYSDDSLSRQAFLYKERDDKFIIILNTYQNGVKTDSSKIFINHPVKNFFYADVNGDGINDIGVGVVKSTRFDKRFRLRPFFYQVSKNKLAPLWLGSKLGDYILDFKPVREKSNTYIMSLERGDNNKYNVILFKWQSFGFKFLRYIKKNADSEIEAREVYERNL